MSPNSAPSQPDPTPYPLDHLAELASVKGEGAAPALVLRDEVLNHDALRQRVDWLAGWLKREIPETGARVATWGIRFSSCMSSAVY